MANPFGDVEVSQNPFGDAPAGAKPFGDAAVEPASILSTIKPALAQGVVAVKEQLEGNIQTLAAAEAKKNPFGDKLVDDLTELNPLDIPSIGQRLTPLGMLNQTARTIGQRLITTSPEDVAVAEERLAKNRGTYAEAQADINAAIGAPSQGLLPTGRELAVGVVTNLARNAPGLAAAIALRANPSAAIIPGLASGAVQSGTSAEYDALDKGASLENALKVGGISGAAEAGFELIPMGNLLKNLGKAKVMELVKNYVLREIPSEMMTSATEDIAQQIYVNPERTLGEFVHDFAKNQIQTVMTTAISAPIQGGAVAGADRLLSGSNVNTPPEQSPPSAPTTLPPLTTIDPIEEEERLEADTGIGLDPVGVDEALAQAQQDIEMISRRLDEGASIDDFIVDIDNSLNRATGESQALEQGEALKQTSVFTNPLVRGLDSVGQVSPDQGQSNEVIDNRNNWFDPNDNVNRTDRLVTRAAGIPEELVTGLRWGDVDVSQLENVQGPVVLQVGVDSVTRPGEVLAAVVQDVYNLAKSYLPQGRFVILPETMGRGQQGTYFYHNGVHYITPRHLSLTEGRDGAQRTVDQHNWNSRQEFTSSVYHEFGHALIMERLFEGVSNRTVATRIAAELQAGAVSEESLNEVNPIVAKLMRDWMDARSKILRGEMSLEEAAARWFSPTKMVNGQLLNDRLKDIRRKSKYKPYTAKELFDALGGADNWLSFTEYLAEQMPKYMHWSNKWGKTETAKALKVDTINAATIGKFFADVIEKMKKIFQTTSASKMVSSSEAFNKWIEHLAHSTDALNANPEVNGREPETPLIDWSDESTVNNVKTALVGLLRDKTIDMQEYKEQLKELKEGNPETVLAYVEDLLGSKLQFDRIGGRPETSLNIPATNGFAFATLEVMNPGETVSAKGLKAAAKKASAKPQELSLLMKALQGKTELPYLEYMTNLSQAVRPLEVASNNRYGTVGMAQVGLFDAVGTTWEVRGEQPLNKQPHVMDARTLGFFRLFEAEDATYIADIQSDVFQRWQEMQKDEDDAEALSNYAWLKDAWVPTLVQYAVRQAARRGAAVVKVATADTMRQIQGWTEAEMKGQFAPIAQRYDGTIAKYVKHRYGATLSPDGKWWEFSTLQEADNSAIVPFGESGQAAPNNTLPSNGSLMFDRTTPEGQTFNQGLRRLLKLAPQNMGIVRKAWAKTYAYHLRLLQLEQMAHLYPDIQPLQDAARDESKFNEVKSFLVRKASEVVDSLSMMSKSTHDFFFDLTREEFRSGVHLTDLVETEQGWTHVPTERLAAAFEKAGYRAGEPKTEVAAKLYLEAKNAIQLQMNRLEKVLLAKRYRKFSDAREDMRHRAMAEVMVAFKRLREVPFWPQQRYGQYVVTVTKKGEEGEMVRLYHGAFDTVDEQQAEFNRLKAKYKTGVKMTQLKLSENAAIVQMIPDEFLEDAIEMLGLSDEDSSALRALADRGEAKVGKVYDFSNRFADGGSTDFFRNFADFTLHTGNLIAKMEFRSYFDRHIRAVNALDKQLGKEGTPAAMKRRKLMLRIASELENHKKQLFAPDTEFYTIRSILSLMHLSFNVVTAVLNLMSIAFTYLWVSAQTNPVRAGAYIAKAFTIGTQMMFTNKWAKTENDLQLAEVIEMGYSRGVIDQAYSYVLAGQASTSFLHRTASKNLLGKSFRAAVDNIGMFAFKKTEEIVRVVSMLMIAQTLQSTGKYSGIVGTQELFEETAKQSRLVVGNYSSNARPSIMAGKFTSLATVFMTYSQMMAFHAYGGMEVGQRRQAKLNGESVSAIKSYTAYTALLMIAIAGIEGLPGMESLIDIIEGIAKKMGWTSDLRKDMRDFIAENTSIDPNLAMKGLGHDVGGFDLSSRLGLGRLVPGADRITNPQADTAAEYYGALGLSLFGVFGGALQGAFKMNQAFNETSGAGLDWTTRTARVMQEFPGAAGNYFDAWEWSRIGPRGPRNGQLLTDKEGRPRTATTAELIARSQGVNPTEVTAKKEESWTRKAIVNYWTARRTAITDAYAYNELQYPDEPERQRGVVEAMNQFNRDLQAQGDEYYKAFGLRVGQLRESAAKKRQAMKKEEKAILPKRERLISKEINELYSGVPQQP